jgi:rare lipoprotein A
MRWRNSAIALLVAVGPGALAQQTPPLPEGVQATGPAGTSGAAESYDEVGYASVGTGDAITATSATLPAGAFAEVTALDTGKTILLRISGTESGPTTLSPAAANLLGVGGTHIPVRVREVDPPDVDAVALREGQPASARMDAPPVLLTGLRTLLKQKNAPTPAPTPTPAPKAVAQKPAPAPRPPATKLAAKGRYQVQVATFSTRDRAAGVAKAMDGHVQPAGRYFRVRLGPFTTRADANRARDAAAKRGYGDARVVTD